MAWPYAPIDYADLAANLANQQAAAAGHQQFQSLLGENDIFKLNQRQYAAVQQDPQQQWLAAQLEFQQQQARQFLSVQPWGSAGAAVSAATPDLSSRPTAPNLPNPGHATGGVAAAAAGANAVSQHHQMMATMAAANPQLFHYLQSQQLRGGFPGHQFLPGGVGTTPQDSQLPSMMMQQMKQMQQQTGFTAPKRPALSPLGLGPASAGLCGDAAPTMPGTVPSDLLFMLSPAAAFGAHTVPTIHRTGVPTLGNVTIPGSNAIVNPLGHVRTPLQGEDLVAAGGNKFLLPATANRKNYPGTSRLSDGRFAACEPTCHDILSGRGNFVNNHPGNKHFRSLVSSQRLFYVAAPKEFKPQFAQKIIEALKSLTPPGRFLQQDSGTKLWFELDDKKAMAKTRQALREGAPEVLKKITGTEDDDDEEAGGEESGADDSDRDDVKRDDLPVKQKLKRHREERGKADQTGEKKTKEETVAAREKKVKKESSSLARCSGEAEL